MQTNTVAMNPQLVAWLCGDGIELCTIDLWLLWLSYPITVTSSSACRHCSCSEFQPMWRKDTSVAVNEPLFWSLSALRLELSCASKQAAYVTIMSWQKCARMLLS